MHGAFFRQTAGGGDRLRPEPGLFASLLLRVLMLLFLVRTVSFAGATSILGLLLSLPGYSQAQTSVVTERVRAELVAHAPDGAMPGRTVRLGLLLDHQPHWHTYWRNPGDSGLPTTLSWELPQGVQAGPIEWPTPKRLPFGPLVNYGYEGRILLPVALSVPVGYRAAAVDVKMRADWLVCREICIPESGEFSLRLPVGTPITAHIQAFADADAALPKAIDGATGSARVEGDVLVLQVDRLPASVRNTSLSFFPETEGVIENAAPMEQGWEGSKWTARIPLSAQRSESPAAIDAVLAAPMQAAGIRISAPLTTGWPGAAAPPPRQPEPAQAPSAAAAASTPLTLTLSLALLGGALLNLMPCVFPVLSLKVMGFAQPGRSRRTLVAGALAYTAGVIASFLLLAGLLLLLRSSGEQLGWGFQLQSPSFVAVLAVLFTLIGLNLAGLFELGTILPSGVATLRLRYPLADDALTGALAVAVASPCTAPFMGVALGAALTLPTGQALAVFSALGLGMALPYLAVACFPGLARQLPRPGAWMTRFKGLMAFPMFATVVWLLWVLGQQTGLDGAVALLGVLVAIAFVAWALGTPGAGRRGRMGLGLLSVAVLSATVGWAVPNLREETAIQGAVAAPVWKTWSPAAVAMARAEGRPVFVDFTAAWCVTCQFNKRTTLSNEEVLAEFARKGVVLMRADWTRRDPQITEELGRLNRSGVPVYVLYSHSGLSPAVLPEILTASAVKQALKPLPVAVTATSMDDRPTPQGE